jgi:hypothetical protein
MNWFVTKSLIWETIVLLICCFAMFRPGWFLDQIYPAAREVPAAEFIKRVQTAEKGERVTFVVEGINIEGEDVRKTISIPLGDPQEPRMRLRAVGMNVAPAGERVTITNVAFGSYAKRIGLESGYEIVSVLEPTDRPSRVIPAALGLLVAAGIGVLQWMRSRKPKRVPAAA